MKELSKKSKYWLPKERLLELKYYCLQYEDYCKKVRDIYSSYSTSFVIENLYKNGHDWSDPTGQRYEKAERYLKRIENVLMCVMKTDAGIDEYLARGVTQGYSYEYLQTHFDIPCCRDTYYRAYRKFFWLLDQYVGY